jgi:hypothetical protein
LVIMRIRPTPNGDVEMFIAGIQESLRSYPDAINLRRYS